jgi:hypothetical protein
MIGGEEYRLCGGAVEVIESGSPPARLVESWWDGL